MFDVGIKKSADHCPRAVRTQLVPAIGGAVNLPGIGAHRTQYRPGCPRRTRCRRLRLCGRPARAGPVRLAAPHVRRGVLPVQPRRSEPATTLGQDAAKGSITHFWSTACGATLRPGTGRRGIHHLPLLRDGGQPRHRGPTAHDDRLRFSPAPAPAPAPAPRPRPRRRAPVSPTLHMMGGRGEDCTAACQSVGRTPTRPGPDGTADLIIFVAADLNTTCEADTQPWWAPDQPSYVWARNNTNYGRCLGWSGAPRELPCDGKHPLVHRLCQCSDAPADGAATAAAAATAASAARPRRLPWRRAHVSATTAATVAMTTENSSADAAWHGPWGTEWIGKTSDMDGF